MRLSDKKYEYIKGEVAHIYKEHDITHPICAEKVAADLGFIIKEYSDLPAKALETAKDISSDGFYVSMNGQDYIFVNDDVDGDRKMMTILHEIGHAVLGHNNGFSDDETMESEAAFFAKYFAAPPPLVHMKGATNSTMVCMLFGTSFEASNNAFAYYEKWKTYVSKYGLQDYDIAILERYGVDSFDQLFEFWKSVKQEVKLHA